MKSQNARLSVVVPVYNEAASLKMFHQELSGVLKKLAISFEIIYVNDGSLDDSADILQHMRQTDAHVHVISLARNFGKEIATTAGIHAAHGDAVLMIDADGQHPVVAIPEFYDAWKRGAKVVVGKPQKRHATITKRLGSKLFNGLFRRLTGITLDPNATDFRLIDKAVQTEFNRMTERNRITRGLIDWLGYDREYVTYTENPRLAGSASYSLAKLIKLAIDSTVSLSTSPLYLVSYIGIIVLPVATILGLGMFINAVFGDPLNLHATGGAYLMVLMLWLVGVLLVSQGVIGLYLSHIHAETQGRPLYIIDHKTGQTHE